MIIKNGLHHGSPFFIAGNAALSVLRNVGDDIPY